MTQSGVAGCFVFGCVVALGLPAVSFGEHVDVCPAEGCQSPSDDMGMLQLSRISQSVQIEPRVVGDSGSASQDLQEQASVADAGVSSRALSPLCRGVGSRTWVTQKTFDYFETAFLPMIIGQLKHKIVGRKLPPISGTWGGVTGEISELEIRSLDIPQGAVRMSIVKGVGVRLDVERVDVSLTFKFALKKILGFMDISGGGDVAVKSSFSATLGAAINAQGTPEASIGDIGLDVNFGTFVIGDYSPIVRAAVNAMLKFLMNNFVTPPIVNLFKATVAAMPRDIINPILAKADFQIKLPFPKARKAGLVVDFRPCSISFGSDYLELGVQGVVLSTTKPQWVYPVQPLPIPERPPQGSENDMYALTMTKWTINSALWFAQQAGMLSPVELVEIDLKPFGIDFGTDFLATVAPRLYERYPGARGIAVSVSALETPYVLFSSKSGITISAAQRISFQIIEWTGKKSEAFGLKVPAKVSADMRAMTDRAGVPRVMVDVDLLSFTPVELLVSPVGEVRLPLLSLFLDVVEKAVLLPMVGKVLAGGIPIHGGLGFSLTDLLIRVDDFFTVGASIELDLNRTLSDTFGGSGSLVRSVREAMQPSSV